MRDVSFSVLGGIGENGKNLYLLKIKSSYFVLDTGLKYPNVSTICGVDSIIPEYTFLENVKQKIKGIFITSALETHSGSLPYLIQHFKVPIYSSSFIIDILKINLEKQKYSNLSEVDFKIVNENSLIDFKDTKISFFGIASFLPETLGLSFEIEEGYIVYISKIHSLQSKDKKFQTNYLSLAKLNNKKKVLALMIGSQGAFNVNKQQKEEILEHSLSSYFASIENNVIISFLIPDLLKIQLVIDIAIEFNLKVALLGKKNEYIVDIALKKGYLKIPSNFLINLKSLKDYLKYKKIVVIIVGKRFESLYRLQRMCKQTDRLIRLNPKDKILLLSVEITGIDKIQNKTLDALARKGFIVDILVKDLFLAPHNYEENFKLILHLLQPKYILPLAGEHRHQYQIKKIAKNFNYLESSIFMLENGDNWVFNSNHLPYIQRNFFKKIGEFLIDGTPVLEGNSYIIKDRELLANDGVIIIACNISLRLKKILGNIEFISKGFLDKTKTYSIIDELKNIFYKLIQEFLINDKKTKWSDFNKNYLREELSKLIFKITKKKPIIIPALITID
ncbi:MAG: ribonuclease J [Candidatus Phytoplasma stylosanthis]|uniref:ribonuclease J n=1 Tax=Candidatus Phytoplasma stylosanthis TaxID=2798314 RepID=UPI00293A923E|nr:ribonuclease J [Candidatus Phytoplasma stylosanthis]MDV3167994.1 ribonuclease J [Candidatus Phytoplasma stylosanthis]MDV3171064.1 ribonuclease J [Candidatus Phytoplasma stylosanthis]MDV3173694.1 ribonuclease J [Candidatus Phytoplasma stylosanthis]MDV3174274.1 ribonuclease J [Candidatus Phytoplasma stylosanthis]MDV3202612.1 ribonuclease J [Candidatus Phytoplasma stylosanthis]